MRFLRFPLGGSSSWVLLKVTVRVVTWRTLTGLPLALRGVSRCRTFQSFQSDGEKGERMVVALRGDSAAGENCGMCKRRRPRAVFPVRAVPTALLGVGGGREVAGADLPGSLNANEPASALAGWDVGPGELAGLSSGKLGKLMLALTGLLNTGVRALRNSVYAVGGVIGVDMSSLCLTVSEIVDEESLLKSSDGKTVDLGVFNGWRTGFVGGMMLMLSVEYSINDQIPRRCQGGRCKVIRVCGSIDKDTEANSSKTR